ncbi:cytochrome oxidase assembly protein ShyY1 [Leucobacter exalbidus]|uniref:SURF1-like protein n=1 Tax=Leucobacter exalbidus TaxID=662960 RepID=A0A940PRB5_9MICO|nr:SURF1 family protein [Leucobacter exalbidus]MBP1325227.1 cytochrome oxidase assembly protein ShyY1 [Leucobacter exalbidus]
MTDTQTTGAPAAVADASTPSEMPGWSFLRSRRWLGYFTMMLIFSIACVWLGNWQFERRGEARAEIDRIDANYGAPAIPLAEEIPDPASFDESLQKWRTATVTGTYVGDPVLARNRPGPDGVGSDMIQALQTTDGRVFYVDRGWVPVDGNAAESAGFDMAQLPQAPQGTVTVEVRLRAAEPEISGRTSSALTVPSIDVPAVAQITGIEAETYTGAYGMLVSESPAGEHGALPAKPERDEGPHLSYALQWYVFILIAGIGVLYAAKREYRTFNEGSDAVAELERRDAVRKRRRGPSDADIEDELLGN